MRGLYYNRQFKGSWNTNDAVLASFFFLNFNLFVVGMVSGEAVCGGRLLLVGNLVFL